MTIHSTRENNTPHIVPKCIAEFARGAAEASHSTSVVGLCVVGSATAALLMNEAMQDVAGGVSPSVTALHTAVAIGGSATAAGSFLFSKAMAQVDRAIGQPAQMFMPARKIGRAFALAAAVAVGCSTTYGMHGAFSEHLAAQSASKSASHK